MPTLRQRNDGCYYIHHYYKGSNTWQIDREGFLYLKNERINVDDDFPTDLFMEMWEKRLVYIGPSWKEYWNKML